MDAVYVSTRTDGRALGSTRPAAEAAFILGTARLVCHQCVPDGHVYYTIATDVYVIKAIAARVRPIPKHKTRGHSVEQKVRYSTP